MWSAEEPSDRFQGMVFPGEQKETWTWHEQARAWYYHRFYDFQPDLNITNPEVRDEIKRIVAFWLQLGVAGFRIDAVPFIIEQTEPGNSNSPKDFDFLAELRVARPVAARRRDAAGRGQRRARRAEALLHRRRRCAQPAAHAVRLHAQRPARAGAGPRATRSSSSTRCATPRSCPTARQWATFLRNHDEIDLSRLTADQRDDVFAEFGPEERMRLYDRGIRRRLAPMLGGDRRRLELAYSLQFTLRGTPVLRYGDEIGMGEDLALAGPLRDPDADAVVGRAATPASRGAASKDLIRPVVSRGDFGFKKINVDAAAARPQLDAELVRADDPHAAGEPGGRLRHLLPRRRRGCRAACWCTGPTAPAGTMVFLHNLTDEPCTVDLSSLAGEADELDEVFADQDYGPLAGSKDLELDGYGYRWIRLRRSNA